MVRSYQISETQSFLGNTTNTTKGSWNIMNSTTAPKDDKPATRPRKLVYVHEKILPFHLVTVNLEGEVRFRWGECRKHITSSLIRFNYVDVTHLQFKHAKMSKITINNFTSQLYQDIKNNYNKSCWLHGLSRTCFVMLRSSGSDRHPKSDNFQQKNSVSTILGCTKVAKNHGKSGELLTWPWQCHCRSSALLSIPPSRGQETTQTKGTETGNWVFIYHWVKIL